ncbi:MAG: hypothetical protein MJ082_01050 [Clostridia bacterium]|nr:hypothetical protein [Clostridia bacterium]
MATFTNQASLSYNGQTVNSNIAVGEILDPLTVRKSSLVNTYSIGEDTTYVVSLVNSGNNPLTGITVSDDLGQYVATGTPVTPLTYTADSLQLYSNGVLQPTPAIAQTDPLTVNGLTVPAGGNILLIYEATPNRFASPAINGEIDNTVTVSGGGLAETLTDVATVNAVTGPLLTITKNVSPVPVSEDGTLTYTFNIQNNGNAPATADTGVVLTDTFNPVLTNLTATLNGTPLTAGQYTYTNGTFTTAPGVITVPAATYDQQANGEWRTTPGVSTLVITGTV